MFLDAATFSSQPSGPARINGAHPEANSVVFAWTAANPLEDASGRSALASYTNASSIRAGSAGMLGAFYLDESGGANSARFEFTPPDGMTEATLFILQERWTDRSGDTGWHEFGSPGDVDHYFYGSAVYTDAFAYLTGRWLVGAVPDASVRFDQPHVLTITAKDNDHRLWVNDSLVGYNTGHGFSMPPTFALGYGTSSSWTWYGWTYTVVLLNKWLPEEEARAYAKNIHEFFAKTPNPNAPSIIAPPASLDTAFFGTLDQAHIGAPFNDVTSKPNTYTKTLDYAYLGAPFVGTTNNAETLTEVGDASIPVTFSSHFVGALPGLSVVTAGAIPVTFSSDTAMTSPHASKAFFLFFGT